MSIDAFYFDGKTSRRFAVEITLKAGMASIAGDIQRTCTVAELQISERLGNAARKLTYSDGAYLEVTDVAGLDAFLAAAGYRDPLAARLQRSWLGVVVAGGVIVAILALSYLFGLPAASKFVAKAMPEKIQYAIGKKSLAFLDNQILAPSDLSEERRRSISNRFNALVPPWKGTPSYEIVFRKSRIGPNAFALPSGQIVLTDEIVALVDDDDAVSGILAHELGHLYERHLLRRLIQSSVVGLVSTAIFGDVTFVIAGIPAVLLDLKYSRDIEREADDYAIAMMKANGISLSRLSLVFEKLNEKSGEMNPYLSSHPLAAERIERIQSAE